MKLETVRRLYQDRLVDSLGPQRARRVVIVSVVLAVLYLSIIPGLILSETSKREGTALRHRQQEFRRVVSEYQALKTVVDGFEKRSPVPAGAATQTVSQLMNLPGTKAATKSIRSMGVKDAGEGLKEENIEVQLEKLTLNELINVWYRIEQAPSRIILKNAQVKRSFENPDLLDATLGLSLFVQASKAP